MNDSFIKESVTYIDFMLDKFIKDLSITKDLSVSKIILPHWALNCLQDISYEQNSSFCGSYLYKDIPLEIYANDLKPGDYIPVIFYTTDRGGASSIVHSKFKNPNTIIYSKEEIINNITTTLDSIKPITDEIYF